MNWWIWAEVERVLVDRGVKPILAVIPDNRDERLYVGPARADFWERVRSWQASGWSIAMHGYQHLYVSRDPGILHLTPRSEFADVPSAEQERRLAAGISIFRQNGVTADAWIAPAHSFDWNTVRLMPKFGIQVISDGLWPWPHTDEWGITWVPSQMWGRIAPRRSGVWTVCYHHSVWKAENAARFRKDVEEFSSQASSLAAVVKQFAGRQLSLADRLAAAWRLFRNHRARPILARLLGRQA